VLAAARRLMDAGDAALTQVERETAGGAGRAREIPHRSVKAGIEARLRFPSNVLPIFRASTTERRCSPGKGGPCSSGWLLPVRRFNVWKIVLMSVSMAGAHIE